MKRDLECSVDKLSFMKENWPSFANIESVDQLSKAELQCSLCLLNIVIDGLSKDEFSCPNKELIRLVIMYVYIQERFDLCEIKELHTKLVMTPVKKKRNSSLSHSCSGCLCKNVMKVVLFAVIGDRCGDRFRNNLSPPKTSMNKAFDYWR